MRIVRRFTTQGQDAYAAIAFTTTNSEIRNPDGSVVFEARDIEVPAQWSQVACDVLAQKYFRKRGVPAIEQMSPVDARAAYRDRRFYTQPDPPAVALVQDLQIEGLHGPIGLPLGGRQPAEIALAILAEITATRHAPAHA